jgi:hypothetical protein
LLLFDDKIQNKTATARQAVAVFNTFLMRSSCSHPGLSVLNKGIIHKQNGSKKAREHARGSDQIVLSIDHHGRKLLSAALPL